MSKIITNNEFSKRRRRQLYHFINFIFNHDKLKNTREFHKFISDPEFDEIFFKKDDTYSSSLFPESEKLNDTLPKKFFGIVATFSNYFTGGDTQTHSQIHFQKMQHFYHKVAENVQKIKINLGDYINWVKRANENFSEISTNFFYLKDVIFESQTTKEVYLKHHQMCNELSQVNKIIFEEEGSPLIDQVDGFLSVLLGICESFERYSDFMKMYYFVQNAREDSKTNQDAYDMNKITQEWKLVNSMKDDFERTILEELRGIIKRYENEYLNILKKYNSLVQYLNSSEMLKMKGYENYLL